MSLSIAGLVRRRWSYGSCPFLAEFMQAVLGLGSIRCSSAGGVQAAVCLGSQLEANLPLQGVLHCLPV